MGKPYFVSILIIFGAFFIAFLIIGNLVSETWIKRLDNAGIIFGYLWGCLTLTIAVYAFIRRQRIAQWFRRTQFSGTGEELDIIAEKVDAIVIPVSRLEQPEWIIRHLNPQWVAFLYTEKSKDIALNLASDFEKTQKFIPSVNEITNEEYIIKNPDDPLEAKEKTKMFIRRFKFVEKIESTKIFVDTTGGKVPMSIGVFQAAEEEGVSSIYIVGGVNTPYGAIIKDPKKKNDGRPIFISNKTGK